MKPREQGPCSSKCRGLCLRKHVCRNYVKTSTLLCRKTGEKVPGISPRNESPISRLILYLAQPMMSSPVGCITCNGVSSVMSKPIEGKTMDSETLVSEACKKTKRQWSGKHAGERPWCRSKWHYLGILSRGAQSTGSKCMAVLTSCCSFSFILRSALAVRTLPIPLGGLASDLKGYYIR